MFNRRRVITFVLLVVFLLATLVPVSAQDDPIEIPIWIAFTDYRLDWARDRAAEFNDMFPQYNVVIEGYDNYEVLFSATNLAFEQGSNPAIVQYFEAATQDARDANFNGVPFFKSIAEAFGDRTEINGLTVDLENFVEPVANYYTLDGEFTSMPWNTSSAIMFVNMDMLDAAGVGIPETWDDVEAVCEAVLALDDGPAHCISWPNHGWFFEQWVAQQDGELVDGGNGREERASEVYVASDAGLAFVEWWKSLQDRGFYIYTGLQRDWGGTYNTFIGQDIALLVYSSSDTTALTNDGRDAGFEVVAAPMPYNAEVGYTGNLIGGASLWLANGLSPEVEDGALTFLLYFTNAENDADWHRVTGYIAVTQAGLDLLESEGWFEESPNSRVANQQLADSTDTAATRGAIVGAFPAIRDQVTEAIEDILVNDLSGDALVARLQAAEERANEILFEYNLLNAPEE
jgi:sn-glycerol 3-phosphate transport system substrate-binding protein